MNIKNKDNISYKSMSKAQMAAWRKLNRLPDYVNATYSGYTGAKIKNFPVSNTKLLLSNKDITKDLYCFEQKVLQKLK